MPCALGVIGRSVLALVRVEVGPGGGAAIGGVSELVDVEAVVAGLETGHLATHGHGARTLREYKKEEKKIT